MTQLNADPEQYVKSQLQAEAKAVIEVLNKTPGDRFERAVFQGLIILIKMVGWSLLR